jgi:hypothetical protein
MAPLKTKGDTAELMIAADLARRGYRLAFPYGEDCDYDLVVDRGNRLERVQVKYTRSDGEVVVVRCRSQSLTNGKVRQTKRYTAATIEWIAVYDATTELCFYIPASELGTGMNMIHLRLVPARNGQQRRTRPAERYTDL